MEADLEALTARDWIYVLSQSSYVETLPDPWDGSTNWSLWEVMRGKWGHEGGALIMGLVPLEESPKCLLLGSAVRHRKIQEVGSLQPGRDLSHEPNHVGT